MKKIALFIPDLGGAGTERVVSNLSLALPKTLYEVYIILYNKEIKYLYDGNIITIDKTNKQINRFLKFVVRTIRLKKIKEKYKFDVFISFLENPDFQNMLTKGKGKTYISVRNYASKSYSKSKKFLAKLLYRKADLIIAVSEEIKQDLVENFRLNKENIKVIYNPYDLNKIRQLSEEGIEPEFADIFDKKVIITAGRLTYQKGQWHLIRAFSELCKKMNNVALVIIGEGILQSRLQALASNLNIGDKVHFLGFKDNPYKYMKKSAIFAFTSLYEGFPNALTEAMICGVPIISSNCKSGPKEILEEDFGILTEEFDLKLDIDKLELCDKERQLASEIKMLLENVNKIEHYKKMSQRRAEDFETSKIMREWIEIL